MNADILTTLSQYTYKKTVQRFAVIFADDSDRLYLNSRDYNGKIYKNVIYNIRNGYYSREIYHDIYFMTNYDIMHRKWNNRRYIFIVGDADLYYIYYLTPYEIEMSLCELYNHTIYYCRLRDIRYFLTGGYPLNREQSGFIVLDGDAYTHYIMYLNGSRK